jgi:hypothetical protein
MDDARHMTDYRPNCVVNNLIRVNNGVLNSYEYRQFMIKNAEKMMELNREYTTMKNSCGPCKQPWNTGTMLPEQNMIICNNRSCNTDFANAHNGLGTGRDYWAGTMPTDKATCTGWPQELPVNQEPNCCGGAFAPFNYYDNLGATDFRAQGGRVAMPSGGELLSGMGGN